MDTGNFHVFFPKGCYRERPTQRREEIFEAIDHLIQEKEFDLVEFDSVKQAYLNTIGSKEEKETFSKLNELVTPLFTQMLEQGFSMEELQNYEAIV